MAKIQIDISGTKGLAPKFYGDANDAGGYGAIGRPWLRYVGAPGQIAQGYWNPLRAFGYLAPPTSMVTSSLAITETDVTYNFDSEMRATLYDAIGTNGSNGKGVWLADVDNIWYQNGGTNAFTMKNIVHLATNTPKITDMEMYQLNGVRKIFFSYREDSGAGGDIGWIVPDASGTSLTWLSGSVSGAFQTGATNNVVMIAADNSYMYLLDGSTVHKIDGTVAGGANGTAYPNILVFPPDFTLVDGVDWQSNIWIAVQTTPSFTSSNAVAHNERMVGVYVWDRLSISTNMQKFIPITGMREIRKIYVTPQGEVRVLGISSESLVQIHRYNGQTFELIQELGIWAYPNYRDSFTYVGGLVAWLGNDGKLYAHGKLPATQAGSLYYTQDQLYILGDMSALPNTDMSPGALLAYGVGNGGTFASPPTSLPGIIFSYADSNGNNKVYQWIISGTGTISSIAQRGDAGNVYTLVQRLPGLSRINYVRIWHLPVGSGGATSRGTLSILKNQSSSPLSTTIGITQTDVQRGYKYQQVGETGVYALQFKLAWQTASSLSDTGDWQPYAIEVDYDEMPKLR